MTHEHLPVLLEEALEFLKPGGEKGIWVDATLGLGGHSAEILKRLSKDSLLFGIDRDIESLEKTKQKFAAFPNFRAISGNFRDMAELLKAEGVTEINGALFDLGVSSPQLDDASRGFSFMKDAALDMRMDKSQELTAKDVVNKYSAEDLERIIRDYGEERFYRRMTGAIIRNRPVTTTLRLAEIASGAVKSREKINPATRLFQALRIEVNGELEAVDKGIKSAAAMLKPGGRMAVISFHSLEDRIVKRYFAKESKDCVCENKRMPCRCGHKQALLIITRKPVVPDERELRDNPRARSARLRAAERL
jgi:16S rRNA (cytosine1402-N4)-methyltransferase